MTKMRGYNGLKSGQVVDFDNSQGQEQWVFGDKFLAITIHFPEIKTDDSWRAQYATKSIFKGKFFYTDGTLDLQKSLVSEMGSFFSQRNQDGSIKETGYGYKFKDGTTFPVGDADNTASHVTFSYSNDESTKWHGTKLGRFPISRDRTVIKSSGYEKYVPRGWGDDPFSMNESESSSANDNSINEDNQIISAPTKFNKKSADKITNFNPSTDTLEIDTDSFGISSTATFASGKNKKAIKKKLAKQDFDFLYDERKGGLYFNENGADKGFGEGGIIAILKGSPELTSGNLEFI